MASEMGLIGLLAFLFIPGLFFYHGILLACLSTIIGYCVQMGVDTTLYSLDMGMLFWLVLGIGTAAMKNLQPACNTRK